LVVLLVIGLQFIPLGVSSWLFNVTLVSGLAVTAAEQVMWSILCFLLALLSIYMVSSSVFALYVSTLPDMTPMKALRSTRELVKNRRWEVLRKVLYLPLVLLIAGAIITVPVILFLTPLAEWVFFILSMAALAITHSYIYSLYRKLL
jgi:polyferredoxin